MSRNISYQLQYCVQKSRAFGESKHEERRKEAGQNRYKTYSYQTYKARLDIAKALGKFVQQNYPDIKMARDITPAMANEFLQTKANAGCRTASLEAYAADIRALFRFNEKYFRSKKYDVNKAIQTPQAKPDMNPLRTAKAMTKDDFDRIRATTKDGSNLDLAMRLIQATGARAGGVCHLHGSDIEVKNDMAIVHIQRGYEKGGRMRDIEVYNKQYIQDLTIIKEKAGNKRIIEYQGHALKPASIEKALQRAMKKCGIKEYPYQKAHSIRKMWAQERYREYRQHHTKLETVQYINEQLGHSAERDEALLACYVDNIF